MQFLDLARHDYAAAPAEYLDARSAAFTQQVDGVLEVFDVAALIRGHGDALHVFLDGGRYDLVDRPVMAEVNDFDPARLQDAAHDVDRGVMAVEQAGCGDEADFVFRLFALFGGLHAEIGHGAVPSVCR